MKGYLLDTNIVIWFLEGNLRLVRSGVRSILDSPAPRYVSIVNLWEIAIKASLGKVHPLKPTLIDELKEGGFSVLPIEFTHLACLQTLPQHHRDPFDRVLVAQAKVEGLALITADRDLLQYGIAVVAA